MIRKVLAALASIWQRTPEPDSHVEQTEPWIMDIKHRGYIGACYYENDILGYFGRVLMPEDLVTFTAYTLEELEDAFRQSIDDYCEWCEKRGEFPAPPIPRSQADVSQIFT